MEDAKPVRVQSENEKKIRSITNMYYSRKDVQKAIFEFSKNREISPRYFEGFGKRPDTFQFVADVFNLVRRGATSFHCSEELWSEPMKIQSGMSKMDADKIRQGWDLLIDIDCEHGMKYSALAAKAIIETFKQHGIKNYGLKFSGSKGFHILIPWKAFPKEINGMDISNLFPEFPRKLVAYIRHYSSRVIQSMLPEEFYDKFKEKLKSGYVCKNCGEFAEEFVRVEFYCESCNISEERNFKDGKGELPKCYKCKKRMEFRPKKKFVVCRKCEKTSIKEPKNFVKDLDIFSLMGLDLVLVSPRHLFRMPYSLHEKSSLVSVVLDESDLEKFVEDKNYKEKVADPLRIEVKDFMPKSKELEAAELVMQALDWSKDSGLDKEFEKKAEGKFSDFKPIELKNLNEAQYPPCIKKILEGMKDGKKRALFALINFFRSVGLDKESLEKTIYEWNDRNEEPLKKSYIHAQLSWTYKRKPLLPPNCRDFYRDLGVCSPEKICDKIKNPVNYTVRKNFATNNDSSSKKIEKKKPKKEAK